MTRKLMVCVLAITLLSLFGCQSKKETDAETTAQTQAETEGASKSEVQADTTQTKPEPDRITVQHILIGFEGSLRGKTITRTKAEAQALAEELLKKAQAGEDFDALVKEFTDDSHPGIYSMANHGVPADRTKQEYSRGRMVAAFGDVGFPLEVGEVGMAAHDPQKSPYGWHIIKRIK
jgi:foldase protein PrsA